MNENKWSQAGAVFAACYIKRWLESRYDALMALPALGKLKAANPGIKYGVEAILYALTAYAQQKWSDPSPLGLMVKTVLMDAAPEISARLLKDTRADLTGEVSAATSPTQQSIASKLLGLEDPELLGILTSLEGMDDNLRAKFLSFSNAAPPEELKRFSSLSTDQQTSLLNLQSTGHSSTTGWLSSAKTFAGDFWAVIKAWSQKTCDLSLRTLNRYLLALFWLLKTCGILWAVAVIMCIAASLCGRWTLLGVMLGLLGACIGMCWGGKKLQKSWLSVAGIFSSGVTALLILLVVTDYADAVFGAVMFFLIGIPVLAIVAMLVPVTTVMEIFRGIFPRAYQTIIRALQMLLTVFIGLVLFSMVLLFVPLHNPVAVIFVVPLVLVLSLAAGVGLVRVNPTLFLRTPVLIGMMLIVLTALGMMSMPNLRNRIKLLPQHLDLGLVDEPKSVSFASSKDIDFVSMKDGETRIWYAEQSNGGFELFRCEGVGPYYTKDGRKLHKADNETIRHQISVWVDQVTAQKIADQETLQRQRQQEEERQQEARQVQTEKARRSRYIATSAPLPQKVDFVVCVADAKKHLLEEWGTAVAEKLEATGKKATATVLSAAFIREGGFDVFCRGEGKADIQAMQLANYANKLLLANCESMVHAIGATVEGLHTVKIKTAFTVVNTSDGGVVERFVLTAVGPGTSEGDARAAAFDRILSQLAQHGL